MSKRVCIIGEADSDPKLVETALVSDFEITGTAVSIEEAIDLCNEQPPDIIILAYYSLDEVENDYIRLLRKARAIHAQPFRSLLLCSGRDAETAYALCCKEVFDDYLVNQPLQDVYQLRWAVRCALEIIHTSQEADVSNSNAVYDEFEQVLTGQLDGLTSISQTTRALHESSPVLTSKMSHELTRMMGNLGRSMESDQFSDSVKVHDIDKLVKHLQQFTKTQMVPVISTAQNGLIKDIQVIGSALDNQHARLTEANQSLQETKAAQYKPTVLLVDDDSDYRETLMDWLDESGYRVICATDVYSALNLVRKRRPDIVLMDYMMPGMNGIETSKLLNQTRPDDTDIPIIMLTGYGSRQVVEQAIGAGIVDFALKTTRFDKLSAKIKSHLLPPSQ